MALLDVIRLAKEAVLSPARQKFAGAAPKQCGLLSQWWIPTILLALNSGSESQVVFEYILAFIQRFLIGAFADFDPFPVLPAPLARVALPTPKVVTVFFPRSIAKLSIKLPLGVPELG